VAAAAVGGAVGARAAETAWLAHIVGRAASSINVPSQAGAGFLQGRFDGFYITWLLPDYHVARPVSQLLLAVVAGLAVAAFGARSAPLSRLRVLVPAGIAAVSAVGALLVAPATLVPGLLVAFPLLTAGAVVLRRASFGEIAFTLPIATSVLFALGVIATQYPSGGTGEWGGRYFAVGIPVVVPALLFALYRQGQALERFTRVAAVGALVVCSAASSGLALSSIRSSHQSGARFLANVERAESVAGAGAPIVATWSAAPRLAWPMYDRSRWLWVLPEDLGRARTAMAAAGIGRFVLVSAEPALDEPFLGGLEVVSEGGPAGGGRHILVVQESDPARRGAVLPPP
jgi:hypothetical protein